LALVLLFARPFLKPSGPVANPETKQHVVLILDASLSMRAVQGGVTLFARAKAEAADVLRGLEPGQEAAVILVGATPRTLLPALSPNLPALHEGLIKAQATFEVGDFQAALTMARRLLGGPGTIISSATSKNPTGTVPANFLPAVSAGCGPSRPDPWTMSAWRASGCCPRSP
jgi:hypothetical protein